MSNGNKKNLDLKISVDDKFKSSPYTSNNYNYNSQYMIKNNTSGLIRTPKEQNIQKSVGGSFMYNYTPSQTEVQESITPKNFDSKKISESYSFVNSTDSKNANRYGKEKLNNITESRPVKIGGKTLSESGLLEQSNKVENKVSKENISYNKTQNIPSNILHPHSTKNGGNALSLKNKEEPLSIMSLLGSQNYVPLSIDNLKVKFDKYDNSKISSKTLNEIRAYAANTNQGIVRNYNEDRVSIILNIVQPQTYTGSTWPKCSFFGIYDGHGGSQCADFLRDHLHQTIIRNKNFPKDPARAIQESFDIMEEEFHKKYLSGKKEIINRSGSCAIMLLFVDNVCYVSNLGDSRAIMSLNKNKDLKILTNDHKPSEKAEVDRIVKAGGKVYQTQTNAKNTNINFLNTNNIDKVLVGPHRVFPGRLSVSRTIGDIEAKSSDHGGIKGVITHIPEIISFKITDEMDYILMGCDGIFDQLSSEEVNTSVWMTLNESLLEKSIHHQCGKAIDMVIKSSLIRKSLDNVTCVIVALKGFESVYESLTSEKQKNLNYLLQNDKNDKNDKEKDFTIPSNIIPQSAKNSKNKNFELATENNIFNQNSSQYPNEKINSYYAYTKDKALVTKSYEKKESENYLYGVKNEDYKGNSISSDRNSTKMTDGRYSLPHSSTNPSLNTINNSTVVNNINMNTNQNLKNMKSNSLMKINSSDILNKKTNDQYNRTLTLNNFNNNSLNNYNLNSISNQSNSRFIDKSPIAYSKTNKSSIENGNGNGNGTSINNNNQTVTSTVNYQSANQNQINKGEKKSPSIYYGLNQNNQHNINTANSKISQYSWMDYHGC